MSNRDAAPPFLRNEAIVTTKCAPGDMFTDHPGALSPSDEVIHTYDFRPQPAGPRPAPVECFLRSLTCMRNKGMGKE